jgi:8-oxo-dGTP pyrophosphatase MutT (NUDIX family)
MSDFVLKPPSIGTWRRLTRERVGAFRIFDVHRGDYVSPSGKCAEGIVTTTAPEWCNVVAVTPDDCLVMIWQYRYGTDSLCLEIPGGVIEANEAPIHAAMRELTEETGYVAASMRPFGVVGTNPPIQNNHLHTFLAEGVVRSAEPAFDEHEECETLLVPVRALPALLDRDEISHALVVVAIERYLRSRRDQLSES